MNLQVFLLVFFLLFSLALLCSLCWPHQGPAQSRAAAKRCPLHRLRHRLAPHTIAQLVDAPPHSRRWWCQRLRMSRPWKEVKSRRGAPKRVNTQGFACPNQQCPSFGITDARVHALVGDGKHGRLERIQTFRGPACHITFTSRRTTPLFRLKTPSHQVAVVLSALAEGLDPSAAERVFGFRQVTIASLSVPCWRARTDPARALLPPSLAPTPPTGRTAHQAKEFAAGTVALAGH